MPAWSICGARAISIGTARRGHVFLTCGTGPQLSSRWRRECVVLTTRVASYGGRRHRAKHLADCKPSQHTGRAHSAAFADTAWCVCPTYFVARRCSPGAAYDGAVRLHVAPLPLRALYPQTAIYRQGRAFVYFLAARFGREPPWDSLWPLPSASTRCPFLAEGDYRKPYSTSFPKL